MGFPRPLIQLQPIRSRALRKAGYDEAPGTLRVQFHHGSRYDYLGVPPEVYAGLRASAHPWTEWGAHIKATYECIPLQ